MLNFFFQHINYMLSFEQIHFYDVTVLSNNRHLVITYYLFLSLFLVFFFGLISLIFR